jgi:hypothetical protein
MITSGSGEFKIEKLQPGNYYLRLTFLGFDKKFIDKIEVNAKVPVNALGDISLMASASQL